MTKITTNVKKGEALLNKTDFKVKFKFKVENCVLQISMDHKFRSNICNIEEDSTRPFDFFMV